MLILSIPITANIVALVLYSKYQILWISLAALIAIDFVFALWAHHRNLKLARFRLWELVIFGELIFRGLWNLVSGLRAIRGASQAAHRDIKRYKRDRA